jgi:hypothetical protein
MDAEDRDDDDRDDQPVDHPTKRSSLAERFDALPLVVVQ